MLFVYFLFVRVGVFLLFFFLVLLCLFCFGWWIVVVVVAAALLCFRLFYFVLSCFVLFRSVLFRRGFPPLFCFASFCAALHLLWIFCLFFFFCLFCIEVIRDMAGAKPVLQHIRQQQVKWFGHITRMPINQPALRAYNTKYSGWRARGRPRKRWSDSVADTLKIQGMSLLQATHLAADRQLCPPATPIGTSGRKKVKVKSKVSIVLLCFVCFVLCSVALFLDKLFCF